jgi:hypothetical protein
MDDDPAFARRRQKAASRSINFETCGGIRELADRLTSKMHGFVELGPFQGSVEKALPLHLRALLHSLADRLEGDCNSSLDRNEIAGAVFDILNVLDTASEGFALVVDYINMLRRHDKGKALRDAKPKLGDRDAAIFRFARAEWNRGRDPNGTIAKSILDDVNRWISESMPKARPMKSEAIRKVLDKDETYWKPNQVSA